jgi:hypothetical protein
MAQRPTDRSSIAIRKTIRALDAHDAADADEFFNMADTNGDGTLERQEFARIFGMIKDQITEDRKEEQALTEKIQKQKRRVKFFGIVLFFMGAFLGVSIGGNTAATLAVVEMAKDTKVGESAAMAIKGSDTIVQTTDSHVKVPLYAAPVMDYDMYSNVKNLEFSYNKVILNETTNRWTFAMPLQQGDMLMEVVAVNSRNSTWMDFLSPVAGMMLQIKNGQAKFIMGDEEYSVCAGTVSCAALKVPKSEAQDLIDLAYYELVANGFTMPHDVETTYTERQRQRRLGVGIGINSGAAKGNGNGGICLNFQDTPGEYQSPLTPIGNRNPTCPDQCGEYEDEIGQTCVGGTCWQHTCGDACKSHHDGNGGTDWHGWCQIGAYPPPPPPPPNGGDPDVIVPPKPPPLRERALVRPIWVPSKIYSRGAYAGWGRK